MILEILLAGTLSQVDIVKVRRVLWRLKMSVGKDS